MDEDEVEIQQLKNRLAEAEAKRAERLLAGRPPGQGRKKNLLTGMNGGLAAAGAVALALALWQAKVFDGTPTVTPGTGQTATQARISQEIAAREAPDEQANFSPWSYLDDRDPMTDRMTRTACVTSSNLVQLSSPYEPVPARLCIRSSPRSGLDVYIALAGDGQIICRTYSGCTIKVRFGNRAVQNFSAADAADGSSNIMFIVNAARMVEGLKSADITRVELTLYQDGVQPIEFPTKDLEWPRPALP